MTAGIDKDWKFHERFFEDMSDFMEMFETCFDIDSQLFSPIELFERSERTTQAIRGVFYDETLDKEVKIVFSFGRFHQINGAEKYGVTAQATYGGRDITLYGWSDDHDMFTFFECEKIERGNVISELFAG